jgi:hypothetical protein
MVDGIPETVLMVEGSTLLCGTDITGQLSAARGNEPRSRRLGALETDKTFLTVSLTC